MAYTYGVKRFEWNPEKNEWLKAKRRVSFEEVVASITVGGLLETLEHPNPDKYLNQRLFVVMINDYAYLVPFIESRDEIFLKTIIPSRRMTKIYLNP